MEASYLDRRTGKEEIMEASYLNPLVHLDSNGDADFDTESRRRCG